MENRNKKRELGIERIIMVIFTVYCICIMLMAPMFMGDSDWMLPLGGMAFIVAWVVHIKQYKDYRFRGLVISGMMLLGFVLHGMTAENFVGIIPTMSAMTILLGIFAIPEVIYMILAGTIFLLVYHAVIVQSFVIGSIPQLCRLGLQVGALFVVEGVTYYLIHIRKETETELKENIEELEKAQHSKDDFMANVSHEIRTPINTISGMSEMVLREELSPTVREHVFDIQTAGRNLQSIVSDILDFSELESGKMDLVEEPYNITSTINDIINMSLAKKGDKTIELIVDCDAMIPCSLLGDELKIRRVIMNLVNNAIKFTNEGCVTISFGCRREAYGINLIVKVKDTGIGIEEENLERLFTSFNQVDTKKNRMEGGIGLGLAIANAIVTKMGGFITVDSVYGEGTEVQFVIPQKILDQKPIVVLNHPEENYIACYINMEKYEYSALREGYSNSIRRMVEQLHTPFHACRSLAELKRQVEKKNFTHIFISWEEFCEDQEYFEELSYRLQVVLILERNMAVYVGGRIQCIYKPFYVLSLASVINGEKLFQSGDYEADRGGRFIAPHANVLVVDDNLMNLKVVEGLLRPYQIKVFTADSGKEAIKKMETMRYDLVFMDHMMPEMDGVETLHHIRQKAGRYFQDVPIVALTANAIGGVREMFLAEGFQDFVAKPIELSVLERVLRRHLPENKIMKPEEAEIFGEIPDAGETESVLPADFLTGEWGKGGLEEVVEEPVVVQVEKADAAASLSEEDVPVPELNISLGIRHCGGSEPDYIEIAQAYYSVGYENIKKIDGFYKEKDWKNYTILVHALKSSSLYAGSQTLSDMAKELEMAGKEGDEEFILAHHAHLMNAYRQLLELMADCPELGIAKDEPKPLEKADYKEIEAEEMNFMFRRLELLFADFESNGVEEILAPMEVCRYHGKPLAVLAERLRKKVQDFDFMGAEEILAAAKDEFK